MRRIAAITIALALTLMAVGAGGSSTSKRPVLKLAQNAPLLVKATGFKSAEQVRVRLIAPKPAAKRVSATATGTFAVTFQDVSIDRCSSLSIVAVGARGSRASLKRADVECPPRL